MPRFVALLRGLNVGAHHRVKMDDLRREVTALGFANVATYIASGNVIFDARATDVAALERCLEQHFQKAFGFPIPTIIRSLAELAAIAAYWPFAADDAQNPAYSRYVYCMRAPADAALQEALAGLRTPVDEFATHGREIYWLCRGKISIVSEAWTAFDKVLARAKVETTSRNLNTLEAILRQFSDQPSPAIPAPKASRRPNSASARKSRSGKATGTAKRRPTRTQRRR